MWKPEVNLRPHQKARKGGISFYSQLCLLGKFQASEKAKVDLRPPHTLTHVFIDTQSLALDRTEVQEQCKHWIKIVLSCFGNSFYPLMINCAFLRETWFGIFICEIRQLVALVDSCGETVLVYGKIVKISFWWCGRREGIPHIKIGASDLTSFEACDHIPCKKSISGNQKQVSWNSTQVYWVVHGQEWVFF